ncbi:MAG: hypothetical protein NVSMB60_23160 [Mycobacterium sp.]
MGINHSHDLLADTVHNFSDALTAVPLWVAFSISRRAATRRYTYGFGRVEDLAGLFVQAVIAISAVVAVVEAIRRLVNPVPLSHLGWVAVAGVVGFVGNEVVAVYRIRVGKRIGSAAFARRRNARPCRRFDVAGGGRGRCWRGSGVPRGRPDRRSGDRRGHRHRADLRRT